jgi:rhodanese-related sulfurtransferase
MIANHPIEAIAPARQTSLGLYVTAKEAYDLWQADPGPKVPDVRTPEEYVFVGHAPMWVNIPFALETYEWDPGKKALRWELSPEFVAGIQAWAAPDEQVLVACRSGGRSAMAINMLAKAAGNSNAWNILRIVIGRSVVAGLCLSRRP